MRALLLKWGTSASSADATEAKMNHGSPTSRAAATMSSPWRTS